MKYADNQVTDLKIAYVGGGSKAWAWVLMSDLAKEPRLAGTVALYDIDLSAARANAAIGNRIRREHPSCRWDYIAAATMEEALSGADFVFISIQPGTLDEMESDVHIPEKYGIYQSVGDTTGPGGLIRALRTVPMFETVARAVRAYCPGAWVVNYTNPMSVCTRALYLAFPQIKAFGCCHEVFGTQKILARAIAQQLGVEGVKRQEIKTNVVGVNHFTWITKATWQNTDLFPVYRRYAEQFRLEKDPGQGDMNWMNRFFQTREGVKFDLFLRHGAIAAAGDRHLAEFCPGAWYLRSPQQAEEYGYRLTPVSWRKEQQRERLARSERLLEGRETVDITEDSGEEAVQQVMAILGLSDLVTNVNLPNRGQCPDLPPEVVVETNAAFTADSVTPVQAGRLPDTVYPLVAHVAGVQELTAKAAMARDLDMAFTAFCMDQQVSRLPLPEARRLFDEMVAATKSYLGDYFTK